jgi:prolyl oligopeptidase
VERVLHRLAADFVGTASLEGKRIYPWLFVSMTGFTTPGTIAQYDFSENEEEKRWNVIKTTAVRGLNPNDFEAQQVGTRNFGTWLGSVLG